MRLILCIIIPLMFTFSQEYRNWPKYSYIRFYEKKELSLPSGSLDSDGNVIYGATIVYFAPTYLRDGIYEVIIGEKISSYLYQISGTNIYMQFSLAPFMFGYLKGVLEV